MHPFAYRLMAGSSRATFAPQNDSGHEVDDDLEADDELDPDEDDELDPDEELDEELEPDEDDAEPEPPRSRAETRTAKLARERNELRTRNEQLTRDLEAAQARPAASAPAQETQEQFNARLAQMDPIDRVAYLAQLQAQNTNNQIANLQFQLADGQDKIEFQNFCSQNTQAQKLSTEVDKRLKDYRKQGMNIPRMDVLKHILGEKALDSLGRSRGRTQRAAEGRIDAQRGRPASGRSDTGRSGDRGDSKSARDKRVENMKI